MSIQPTAVERLQEAFVALKAARDSEWMLFGAFMDALNVVTSENAVLRATAFPDGVQASTPLAMIFRIIADRYGERDREGDTDLDRSWREHVSALDAIIERLDLGDTIRTADMVEIRWWFHTVIFSSRVIPDAISIAFITAVNQLANRWGWPKEPDGVIQREEPEIDGN